jgi:hypothetical protein
MLYFGLSVVAMCAPTYDQIKAAYDTKNPPAGFKGFTAEHGEPEPNTCAVRLSYALNSAQADFFNGIAENALKWESLITRADHLAIHLNKKLGKATKVTKLTEIADKNGIIFFDKISGFSGTGHISLWNGSIVVDTPQNNYFERSDHVWFWPLN